MAYSNWREKQPSPHAVLSYQQATIDALYGPSLCPGFYCGRVYNEENRTLSACQACPRGQRSMKFDVCTPCVFSLQAYDWIYLASMVLLCFVVNQLVLDLVVRPRSRRSVLVMLVICSVFETLLSAVAAVLINVPVGKFSLHTCGVGSVMDWYTFLYNPTPNFESTIYCAQEAVFPLYSIVFEFLLMGLALLFILRLPLIMWKSPVLGRNAFYVMLYAYPAMGFVHAVAAGVIYYVFPYLLLMAAVGSMAAHMASRPNQQSLKLFLETWSQPRNIIIFLLNWLLFCFSITTVLITSSSSSSLTASSASTLLSRWPYYAVAPAVPYLFYIITAHFTDPSRPHAAQLHGSTAFVRISSSSASAGAGRRSSTSATATNRRLTGSAIVI